MAVVLGTNAGFVTVAPTENPAGTATTRDAYAGASKDVAPVGAVKITEVGWWSDVITEETNFEIGLYSHNAGSDKPGTQLFVDATNAKGTAAGWKTVAVDWDVVAGTTYWLAYQIDNTATATKIDVTTTGGLSNSFVAAATLPATWAAGSTENASYADAIYAVWEAAGAEYVDITGTITGTSDLSGTITVISVLDVTGSIAGTGSLVGTITVLTSVNLTGSIAGTGSLSGSLMLSSNWQTSIFATIRRLVVAGNDSVYYEDI